MRLHHSGAHSIRNVAIVSHVDHGKTTLSDALLLKAGLLHKDRAGDQVRGRSLDTLEDEVKRGITIKSAPITLDLKAKARALFHGTSGQALARALTAQEKDPKDTTLHLSKLPSSITSPEELQAALEKCGWSVAVSDIDLHTRRSFAYVMTTQSLADDLVAAGSLDLGGHSTWIERAGANGMTRLQSYCYADQVQMPHVVVHKRKGPEGSALYSAVAAWDAFGGVIIQAAEMSSSKSKARQLVAEECLEFARKQRGVSVPTSEDEQPSNETKSATHKSSGEQATEVEYGLEQAHIRLNLIDSPGHIDFNAEVTAALRLCDGALVVVDAVEGKAVQTDNVLMQALKEGVRPVLMLNKVDRLIVDKQLSPAEVFDVMSRVVQQVNNFIQAHQLGEFPDQCVSFENGSVCLSSGYFGWSCTIDSFIPQDCPPERYDSYRKALSKRDIFVKQILQPIVRLHRLCGVVPTKKPVTTAERKQIIADFLRNSGKSILKIEDDEMEQPRKLLKKIMMAWLPAADALVDMIAAAVPSPVEAQLMRAPLLYTGDMEDASGQAIMRCDQSGPTVVYISKMIPSMTAKKTLVAYGRVFSGEVKLGDSLFALQGNLRAKNTTVTKIMYCALGKKMNSVESAQAGQLVALEGVDKVLSKAGTLCSDQNASPIRHMHFSVTPVVQHGVLPRDKRLQTKMVTALSRIVASDSTAAFYKDTDTDEYILAGAGSLHIEILVSALLQDGIEVSLTEPRVNYRETVQSESSTVALAKSDNKHNRIWIKALPLSDTVVSAMTNGLLLGLDTKTLGKKLSADFGWDQSAASRVWAVGPDAGPTDQPPTCIFVDSTFGLQIPDDARGNLVNAFQQVVSQGVLVGSPLHGVRFDLVDARFHQDAVHRRPNSVVPAGCRSMRGAFLYSEPALLEPISRAVVTGAPGTVHNAFSVLGSCGGQVVDTFVSEAGNDVVEALIPVRRSFGLSGRLCGATQGYAQCSLSFDSLQPVLPSEHEEIISETRALKKLPDKVPPCRPIC